MGSVMNDWIEFDQNDKSTWPILKEPVLVQMKDNRIFRGRLKSKELYGHSGWQELQTVGVSKDIAIGWVTIPDIIKCWRVLL